MADRTRTVVVARFTVEVEVDAEEYAALTKERQDEVAGDAEEFVDRKLARIGNVAAALGVTDATVTWDSEEVRD